MIEESPSLSFKEVRGAIARKRDRERMDWIIMQAGMWAILSSFRYH